MTDIFSAGAASSPSDPVECFGQTFASDNARREHFIRLLAEKLKDPEFRKQEGFPQGTDEAILAMSDPPYYTACPNPWLNDFVKHYGKPYDPSVKYSREPLAIDVSVGKTDPIYKAHSYHTKVPHLAIVPSILHYTEPGDIVLDGFAGSGMTGVAAQWCASAPAVYRHELEIEWKKQGKPAPKWGARRVILNDLSPAATFIAANYNLPFDVDAFAKAGGQLLKEIEQEIGWMYETLHIDGKTKGRIEFTVWSEVFTCPECAGEVNFLDEALDEDSKRVRDTFPCPHCGAELTKKKLEKLNETFLDPVLNKPIRRAKRIPSLISYVVNGTRYEKRPDANDLAVLTRMNSLPLQHVIPVDRMMHAPENLEKWGDKWRAGTASFSHVHHLFLPRAAQAMGKLWEKAKVGPASSRPGQQDAGPTENARIRHMLLFMVEQGIWGLSVLNRYQPIQQGRPGGSQVNRQLTGVYYVGSQHAECSPWYNLGGKLDRLVKAFTVGPASSRPSQQDAGPTAVITTGTAAHLQLADASIDYVFTDPPFGDNLAYSELNFLVEAFHGVFTHQAPEAVISDVQHKGLLDYHHLMRACFEEYFRVLKPGRWMTVVFSNTQAAVWNCIQPRLSISHNRDFEASCCGSSSRRWGEVGSNGYH
jgi:rubredoxin